MVTIVTASTYCGLSYSQSSNHVFPWMTRQLCFIRAAALKSLASARLAMSWDWASFPRWRLCRPRIVMPMHNPAPRYGRMTTTRWAGSPPVFTVAIAVPTPISKNPRSHNAQYFLAEFLAQRRIRTICFAPTH